MVWGWVTWENWVVKADSVVKAGTEQVGPDPASFLTKPLGRGAVESQQRRHCQSWNVFVRPGANAATKAQ